MTKTVTGTRTKLPPDPTKGKPRLSDLIEEGIPLCPHSKNHFISWSESRDGKTPAACAVGTAMLAVAKRRGIKIEPLKYASHQSWGRVEPYNPYSPQHNAFSMLVDELGYNPFKEELNDAPGTVDGRVGNLNKEYSREWIVDYLRRRGK
jgi:hypothetical protein